MRNDNIRLMLLHEKIDKNVTQTKMLRLLALCCIIFSTSYCIGTTMIETVSRSEIIAANIVWIVSLIALIGIFIKDSAYIKKNNAILHSICNIETEALERKKK